MDPKQLTSKEMGEILHNLNERKEDTDRRLSVVEKNWEKCQKNKELITREEAILAASMSSPSLGDKVTSSGDIYHDELLRTLQRSWQLYTIGATSVVSEQNKLLALQAQYYIIENCINDLSNDDYKVIKSFYHENKTAEEGADIAQVSLSTFYRLAKDTLNRLTELYNDEVRKRYLVAEEAQTGTES